MLFLLVFGLLEGTMPELLDFRKNIEKNYLYLAFKDRIYLNFIQIPLYSFFLTIKTIKSGLIIDSSDFSYIDNYEEKYMK